MMMMMMMMMMVMCTKFLFTLEDQSINALMQIVAVCCEDRTEHTNTVREQGAVW